MQLRPHILASFALVCVLAACDATEPALPGSLAITAGDAQAGAAGAPLPIPPAVRVLDTRGAPLGGVQVAFSVTAGGGVVEHATAVTGSDGIASAGEWTLGPQVGANALTASVAGVSAVTFAAFSTPGAPAVLEAVAGEAQTARVGTKLPVIPVVRAADAFGNPTPGVAVRFTTEPASGSIAVSIAATDEEGVAHAGTWTLDTIAGMQSLTVSVDHGPTLRMSATGLPERPVTFRLASPATQVGTVGENALEAPSVVPRDRYHNPVPGTSVRFTIAGGGGSLRSAAAPDEAMDTLIVTAGASGAATVGRWVFGTKAGSQAVRAAIVDDTVQTLFTADAHAGPPTGLTITTGQDQTAQAGTIVATRPGITVADRYLNPIAGLPVTFTADNGGIVNLGATSTRTDGSASPLSWILGPQPGPHTLIASAPGVPDAVFRATATPGEPFQFEFFFLNATAELESAMRAAADRWQRVLLAGQPDSEGTVDPPFCGPVSQTGPFDDLRLILLIDSIDGPGQILASAGPCAIRSSTRMPVIGGIQLDAGDVDNLLASGRLTDVLVHEIGHILGIGTRWGGGLLVGSTGDDPYFVGGAARTAFAGVGGDTYAGLSVPVENTGGAGTRNGHWRESVFHDELMTGYINPGNNPLSAVSIASLQDIGYLVDLDGGDAWFLGAGLAQQSFGVRSALPLIERAWPRDPVELGLAR